MRSITLHSHIGTDGVLNVRVPTELSNADVEVVVIFHPTMAELASTKNSQWPPHFFELTYGMFRDQPMVREDQGSYETRDPLP